MAARTGAFQRGPTGIRPFPVSCLVAGGDSPCAPGEPQIPELSGTGRASGTSGSSGALLRTSRAVQCEASQIVVVSGSQQALALSARILLDTGTPVWIEEPGYEFMRDALSLTGCRVVPVPVDGEGIDVAAGMAKCRQARAAFVTPSHQFPLGVTRARRAGCNCWSGRTAPAPGSWRTITIASIATKSMPVASLQGLDGGSRVIYIGTFSKTLSLRCA